MCSRHNPSPWRMSLAQRPRWNYSLIALVAVVIIRDLISCSSFCTWSPFYWRWHALWFCWKGTLLLLSRQATVCPSLGVPSQGKINGRIPPPRNYLLVNTFYVCSTFKKYLTQINDSTPTDKMQCCLLPPVTFTCINLWAVYKEQPSCFFGSPFDGILESSFRCIGARGRTDCGQTQFWVALVN